jgi:hypothetical protein
MVGKKKHKPEVEIVSDGRAYTALRNFFSYCPHPFAIQDLMATLAAGNTLAADLVPVYLLPHVLLLHAIAPEPGIVDDIVMLVERLQEEYENPSGNGPRFWHPQAFLVSGLVYGICDADELVDVPDAQYMHLVYSELTHDDTWKKMFAGLPVPKAGKQASKA